LRIGVFVCRCGVNMARVVNVKRVVEEVKKLPGVVHAEDYTYMCSEPGQELIVRAIREHGLDGVVVAACTPSLHYETFARAVERAGLSRYGLAPAFSALEILEGKGPLKGRKGQVVFSEKVTVLDDPFYKTALGTRSIDDEGVATASKPVVEHGVLRGVLHSY
jgi:hypothetical protein